MQETVEQQLGYLVAKVEEVHADLKQHIVDENKIWDDFDKRLELIENDHKQWKTVYWFLKGIAAFIVAAAALEWTNIGKVVKKVLGWE